MKLIKVIVSIPTEHKEFLTPFGYKEWTSFNNYIKHLFNYKKDISIKMVYEDNSIKEEIIKCETN